MRVCGLIRRDQHPGCSNYQSLGQVYIGGLHVLLEKNNFVDISQNDTASGVLIHVGNNGSAGRSNPDCN